MTWEEGQRELDPYISFFKSWSNRSSWFNCPFDPPCIKIVRIGFLSFQLCQSRCTSFPPFFNQVRPLDLCPSPISTKKMHVWLIWNWLAINNWGLGHKKFSIPSSIAQPSISASSSQCRHPSPHFVFSSVSSLQLGQLYISLLPSRKYKEKTMFQ